MRIKKVLPLPGDHSALIQIEQDRRLIKGVNQKNFGLLFIIRIYIHKQGNFLSNQEDQVKEFLE
jgi:hypothetical protein